jgi:hypothetical protein
VGVGAALVGEAQAVEVVLEVVVEVLLALALEDALHLADALPLVLALNDAVAMVRVALGETLGEEEFAGLCVTQAVIVVRARVSVGLRLGERVGEAVHREAEDAADGVKPAEALTQELTVPCPWRVAVASWGVLVAKSAVPEVEGVRAAGVALLSPGLGVHPGESVAEGETVGEVKKAVAVKAMEGVWGKGEAVGWVEVLAEGVEVASGAEGETLGEGESVGAAEEVGEEESVPPSVETVGDALGV